jgi:sugar phosphate isomerase/epimerase
MMPWGSTIHSEIERRTNIDFELDTFWLFNAHVDPLATMEKLKDRVHVIHLKDGFVGGKGIPLGEGEAPVKAVREKAIEMGLTMVVESETLTPSGLDEAERCIKYLRSIE